MIIIIMIIIIIITTTIVAHPCGVHGCDDTCIHHRWNRSPRPQPSPGISQTGVSNTI